ncbi:MAG: hypothetical protein IJS87_08130, partial [Rhodocyclaceae bacterium]|nr:hypothetical protein [Rhodocyclaceae bacterium]
MSNPSERAASRRKTYKAYRQKKGVHEGTPQPQQRDREPSKARQHARKDGSNGRDCTHDGKRGIDKHQRKVTAGITSPDFLVPLPVAAVHRGRPSKSGT